MNVNTYFTILLFLQYSPLKIYLKDLLSNLLTYSSPKTGTAESKWIIPFRCTFKNSIAIHFNVYHCVRMMNQYMSIQNNGYYSTTT